MPKPFVALQVTVIQLFLHFFFLETVAALEIFFQTKRNGIKKNITNQLCQ